MSEFLEDPSVLTKEKLKSELMANDVPLPSGEQKKDVYVQLYRQHLTTRNRATPDFSSDDERESTPMRGRGRPPGRKATKKTNKPNTEEKNEDVTELSTETLKEELLKFGINPGPIMGSTRKVYEKRLLKVKEQQVTSVISLGDVSNFDTKQNGNSDSAQYSDNEEPKIDLTFETREPIRGKSKVQVTSRSRRLDQNETAEETEFVSELNVRRQNRTPPKDFAPGIEELSSILFSISGDALSEPPKMVEPEKVGRVQTISKESSRVARRTPRKRVAPEQVPDDDADVTEAPTVTETILPSSNQPSVDNQVTEVFKHTNSLRAVSEFSELSRRTPKKQPIIDKHMDLPQQPDADSLVNKANDVYIVGHSGSSDLLNTALIEETGDIHEHHSETPKKTKQLKITKFATPLKQLKQMVEKTYVEERREDRDVLKEMFPYETSTPTGISATCRRPIKGAAGRPLSLKDYKIEEGYTAKYVSKYQPVIEEKTTNPKPGRSIPMWIKILLFVVLAVFSFLVYQVMETNEGNPFTMFLTGEVESKTKN